jgi:hypothetical protein
VHGGVSGTIKSSAKEATIELLNGGLSGMNERWSHREQNKQQQLNRPHGGVSGGTTTMSTLSVFTGATVQNNRSVRRGLRQLLLLLRMHRGVSGIDEWRILQYNKSGVVTAKTLGGVSGGGMILYYRSGFTESHNMKIERCDTTNRSEVSPPP